MKIQWKRLIYLCLFLMRGSNLCGYPGRSRYWGKDYRIRKRNHHNRQGNHAAQPTSVSFPAERVSRAFAAVKPSRMAALLVGNDGYRPVSGFPPLAHCGDDVMLLSRLLTVCCKVKAANVFAELNITASRFKEQLAAVADSLEARESLFIAYSGYGARDGSLVFVDGSYIRPNEIKRLVNSFANNTALLIDACYAGNNEGPLEQPDNSTYRHNCLRMYAFLAHNTAREITYENEYFYRIKDFQRDVLGLEGGQRLPATAILPL